MSRTAIWKHVKQLLDLNLPIQCLPHTGYKLNNPLILLDKNKIQASLNLQALPFNLHLFASLDSTNRFLKELPSSPLIEICCAEMQTHGRGRFGRHWHSPFGENIYCSSRWHFDCDLSRLSGLSLIVSLAVITTLADFGIRESIQVKWPNDILWQNKKLCGNLIEVIAESNGGAEVVIGIGLNVNSNTTDLPLIDSKPWCSLYDITGNLLDRNELVARLITHLHLFLTKFMSQGFAAFMTQWQEVDYLQDKMVTVTNHAGVVSGRANGVNETGQLILVDERGILHYLSSGDTSLSRAL
jgi:BirA family biotin operon repressor/biotin-[acetyl-CoA-carboxylase] ligase